MKALITCAVEMEECEELMDYLDSVDADYVMHYFKDFEDRTLLRKYANQIIENYYEGGPDDRAGEN